MVLVMGSGMILLLVALRGIAVVAAVAVATVAVEELTAETPARQALVMPEPLGSSAAVPAI